ncbi:hypothetical protein PAPYR_1274 [Paratrimastix pyriformis]|uniref:Uncharacterized protein n=1 Tax=Paratrimastix pyriformis TaxID=342808 RepID=A0ABQ8USI8_9EUKA|nr:hypothetical protein PAPYR_1274 [Paratrimastix pyriformis]
MGWRREFFSASTSLLSFSEVILSQISFHVMSEERAVGLIFGFWIHNLLTSAILSFLPAFPLLGVLGNLVVMVAVVPAVVYSTPIAILRAFLQLFGFLVPIVLLLKGLQLVYLVVLANRRLTQWQERSSSHAPRVVILTVALVGLAVLGAIYGPLFASKTLAIPLACLYTMQLTLLAVFAVFVLCLPAGMISDFGMMALLFAYTAWQASREAHWSSPIVEPKPQPTWLTATALVAQKAAVTVTSLLCRTTGGKVFPFCLEELVPGLPEPPSLFNTYGGLAFSVVVGLLCLGSMRHVARTYGDSDDEQDERRRGTSFLCRVGGRIGGASFVTLLSLTGHWKIPGSPLLWRGAQSILEIALFVKEMRDIERQGI